MPDFHHVSVSDFVVLREDEGAVIDVERLLASAREVERQLEGRTDRVLVDARGAQKAYTFADAYRIAQAFKDAPGHRSGHIAILGDYEQDFEKAQALQYYYREAGVDARAFLDYDEAVTWLTGEHRGPVEPGPAAPGL